jgi:organic hydroperoxide reductase OsmC/OhrA
MPRATVELSTISGTEAAAGWAGGHTVVVDRPDGRAGGRGLGFNGAELLGLAIGGCFCNDLRYAAHAMGVSIDRLAVSVTVEMDGNPPLVTGATLEVGCRMADASDPMAVIARARAATTVGASVVRGFPVDIRPAQGETA